MTATPTGVTSPQWTNPAAGTFLPQTSIEVIRDQRTGRPPRFALFDFDGTLSLVREGWMDIMLAMMAEILAETGTSESPAEIDALCRDFIFELTGKPTIHQMIRLAEEVKTRGREPLDPSQYGSRFLQLLMDRVRARRRALKTGQVSREAMMVPGSLELLQGLKERGVALYLASGTDQDHVREECVLLGLDEFFGPHMYGALPDPKAFSKQMVVDRILEENDCTGEALVGFGDGNVEIDNVKGVGGSAVGVASDEAGRSGQPDAWKRHNLIAAGADVIVPDYQHVQPLLDWLWSE